MSQSDQVERQRRSLIAAPLARSTAGSCPAQAGRDGPGGPKRARRRSPILAMSVDAVRTLRKFWLAKLAGRKVVAVGRESALANDAIEQVDCRAACSSIASNSAASTTSSCVTVPLRELDDAALVKLSREGQLYLVARRNADDSSAFPRAWAAIRPMPNWKRSPKPGASIAATRRWPAASPIAAPSAAERARFENMLKETIFAATQKIRAAATAAQDDWCVSVFKDNAGIVRFDDQYNVVFKVETHNHPSALGALRRREHRRRRRDSRSAGHRPGRQADLQHRRVLLRSARYAGRFAAAGRAASAARDEGRRRRRARLRQSHGHSDGQRRDLFRPALPGQSAGLLRQRRPDAARQVVQGAAAGRSDRRRRRPHRPRRHSRRDVQLGRADQRKRNALRRRGANRQCDHRKDGARRGAASPRSRACITRSPIAAPADFPAPSAKWAKRSARRCGSIACR